MLHHSPLHLLKCDTAALFYLLKSLSDTLLGSMEIVTALSNMSVGRLSCCQRTLSLEMNPSIDSKLDAVFSRESYNALQQWLIEARNLASAHIVVVLVGNKKDLHEERQVMFLEASQFAQENGTSSHCFAKSSYSSKKQRCIQLLEGCR